MGVRSGGTPVSDDELGDALSCSAGPSLHHYRCFLFLPLCSTFFGLFFQNSVSALFLTRQCLRLLSLPCSSRPASFPSSCHLCIFSLCVSFVCLVGFRCPSFLSRSVPLFLFLLSLSECFSISCNVCPSVNLCLWLSFSLSHYSEM